MTTTRTRIPTYLAFDVEVAAVRRLSPNYTRVTFTGDLGNFADGGPLGTRDMRLKIIVPAAADALSPVDIDTANWYRRWLTLDPSIRGHMRTYTARAARLHQDPPEVDVDFVLHLNQGGHGGPATTWAAAAKPGDRLTILGPNRHCPDPSGIEWRPPTPTPRHPVHLLLAADETACPAIAAILETLSRHYTGDVLIEVPDAADIQHLTAPPGVQIIWLVRGERDHGQMLKRTVEEVMSTLDFLEAGPSGDLPDVDIDTDILWDTPQERPDRDHATLYAWIAGEAGTIRDIRRSLVLEHHVPRQHVAFMGYWRRGRAEAT